MTLILGARCIDGVVVAADRKIIDLFTRDLLRYDDKVFGVLRNVIFAYEGAEAMFRVFLRYVAGDVIILRDREEKYTANNLIQKLSTTMNMLREIRDQHSKDFRLSVMVARQFPKNGKSDLYVVRSNGKFEYVNEWIAIGSGQITVKDYVKRKWNTKMTTSNFARMSYSLIKCIEKEGLNESVGLGGETPSIKYLMDGEDLDIEPSINEFKEFEESYDMYAKEFMATRGD